MSEAASAADDPDASIGFTRVDAQPDTAMLIEGMDATAQWPSVRQLRAWERDRLRLRPGERVVDIGSGERATILQLARLIAAAAGGSEPKVSGNFRDGDVRSACGDIEAARQELGY